MPRGEGRFPKSQASRHSLSHVLEAPQGQTKAQVRCRLAVHVAPSLPLTLGAGTQRGSAFLSSLCAPQGASLPVDSAPAVCLPIFPRSRLCAWHPWWLHLQHILAQMVPFSQPQHHHWASLLYSLLFFFCLIWQTATHWYFLGSLCHTCSCFCLFLLSPVLCGSMLDYYSGGSFPETTAFMTHFQNLSVVPRFLITVNLVSLGLWPLLGLSWPQSLSLHGPHCSRSHSRPQLIPVLVQGPLKPVDLFSSRWCVCIVRFSTNHFLYESAGFLATPYLNLSVWGHQLCLLQCAWHSVCRQ